VTAGQTYYIDVDGYSGQTGNVHLRWTMFNDNARAEYDVPRQTMSGANGTIAGSTLGATKERGEPDHAGNAGGASFWYRWTAPSDGVMTIDPSGSSFRTLLAAYNVGYSTNFSDFRPVASSSSGAISFVAQASTTYQIAIDGWDGAGGDFQFTWNLAPGGQPANDNFADAPLLTGSTGSTAGANIGASREAGEPNINGHYTPSTVWWKWVAPARGAYEFDTCGSDFDTATAGCSCLRVSCGSGSSPSSCRVRSSRDSSSGWRSS
jgi:hypothetical protein